MKHCIDSAERFVTRNYNRIKVSVCGSGTDIILLLGRKTSPSSIIEMKPLISFLEDKYTVVTFDYPGSGQSKNYQSKRTLDNITIEIHDVMNALGYTSYVIAAFTYSGLYSLYYIQKYPNEVKAIIGIDAFVSNQGTDLSLKEKTRFYNDLWRNHHQSKCLSWIVEKAAAIYLKQAKSYTYSDEDIDSYSNSASYMLNNMTTLDEYKCPDENFKVLQNVHFPQNIPIMFILSEHRCKKMRNWYDWHKPLLQNSDGKIIILKGGKNLHLTQPEKLADQIKSFTPEG